MITEYHLYRISYQGITLHFFSTVVLFDLRVLLENKSFYLIKPVKHILKKSTNSTEVPSTALDSVEFDIKQFSEILKDIEISTDSLFRKERLIHTSNIEEIVHVDSIKTIREF